MMIKENEHLIELLSTPQDQPYPLWRKKFYESLPKATIYNYGPGPGPDGHDYILVSASPISTQSLDYSAFNDYALDRKVGLAIAIDASKEAIPSIYIPYGCLWSYKEFGSLLGPPTCVTNYNTAVELFPENPFSVLKDNPQDQWSIGDPSFQFLPEYVRGAISTEIHNMFGNIFVTFKLYKQEKYLLSDRIMIELEVSLTNEQSSALGEYLMWYLPTCLPLIISQK